MRHELHKLIIADLPVVVLVHLGDDGIEVTRLKNVKQVVECSEH